MFFRMWTVMRQAVTRPIGLIALVSVAAVIVSAYPVVFAGKSYVSPNYGTPLLYGTFPTLPGYSTGRIFTVDASDVGAIMWQHIPYSTIEHRALVSDGELPFWCRYDCGGVPLLGQGQSMFGDPLHFLVIAANGAAWAWDLKYLIAKWLMAMGLGLLVIELTKHLPSALIVSFAAPFAGFFLYRLNHPAFFSFCYAPWSLYCVVRIAHAAQVRSATSWVVGLLVANLALMNSGTVKEAYIFLLSMNFSGGCVLLAASAPWRERLWKLAGIVWAGILFILMTAPIWITFYDTLKVSFTESDLPAAYQVQPALALATFDEALSRPLGLGDVYNPSANFLILAGLLYFFATMHQWRANREITALALSSLVPVSLVFGLVPPSWITQVPFLASVIHIDDVFLCVLVILWTVLAGVGFTMASRRLGKPEGRNDLLSAASMLLVLVLGYVGCCHAVHRVVAATGRAILTSSESVPVSDFIWKYLVVLLAALVAFGLVARRALVRGRATWLEKIGIVLCVGTFLWRPVLRNVGGHMQYSVRAGPRVDFHAESASVRFVQEHVGSEPARAIGLNNYFFPGWTAVYQLEGIAGPDALMNRGYHELERLSPLMGDWDWRYYVTDGCIAAARPFLDFLNVRYYFVPGNDSGASAAGLTRAKSADLDVYESPTVWPRAFFTDRLGVYETPKELIQQILKGDGRPFAAVQASDLAANPGLAALSGEGADRTIVPAENYRLTENTTSFDIRAPGPGTVVLTETLWPGYSSLEIDGREAKPIRINHAFQGVAITAAGMHTLKFSYCPPRFGFTVKLAALGFALFLGSGLAVWKWSRRREAG
jgi:hypothetical protein